MGALGVPYPFFKGKALGTRLARYGYDSGITVVVSPGSEFAPQQVRPVRNRVQFILAHSRNYLREELTSQLIFIYCSVSKNPHFVRGP